MPSDDDSKQNKGTKTKQVQANKKSEEICKLTARKSNYRGDKDDDGNANKGTSKKDVGGSKGQAGNNTVSKKGKGKGKTSKKSKENKGGKVRAKTILTRQKQKRRQMAMMKRIALAMIWTLRLTWQTKFRRNLKAKWMCLSWKNFLIWQRMSFAMG